MVYRIGIVDDEPEVAQVLTEMLARYKEEKNCNGGGGALRIQYKRVP